MKLPGLISTSAAPVLTIPKRMNTGIETGINGQDFRVALTARHKEGGPQLRRDILALFKTMREDAMTRASDLFLAGRLGGLEMARRIAAIHDEVLTALYDYTVTHIVRASNPTQSERLAVCAVGGNGRGEMAPFSDIDLLFLLADNKGSAFTESVTEHMLYMLWDMGLKVGQSTRSIEQCLSLAKEDQTILTALLDVRFLSGDEVLANDLYGRFRKDISKGNGRHYIAQKLAERDTRHTREGNSRYVIEPNIKEGKGGLRDLHVLYWIARYLDKDGAITDAQATEPYVQMRLFDKAAARRFARAADFLWRARIHLHLTAKRPTESLSFDHQTVLARKMGHASGPVEVAVERFMREYFTNAREVGALTRIACARLEDENALSLPKGLSLFVPNRRRGMKNKDFLIHKGRINFADDMQIRERPELIMQLFNEAGRHNLDIHPDAFQAINFRRNLIDNTFRRRADIFAIFKETLLESAAPYATLKAMNESGVLGRYLLEFGGIVARTQFNMHHAFTVDEHTLYLVNYFHDLLSAELDAENPVAARLAKGFSDDERLTLYLTCLLHDTGKGQGDQCIEGAMLGRRACRRMGVPKDITDTVAWLIRRHLDLSETAQRRDISDPETIAEFGALIGSQQRLDLLYVLTIVDIRAVGPDIYNDWKGSLLRELYRAASDYLSGRPALAPKAKADAAKEQLFERLPEKLCARVAPIMQELPDGYFNAMDMSDLVRHARFLGGAMNADERPDLAVATHRNLKRDHTELRVMTQDRRGLFADLCLAISASNASIIGARLFTGTSGLVMNVFYLQNAQGLAYGRDNDGALKTLQAKAEAAVRGEADDLSLPNIMSSRRAEAIPVHPDVSFSEAAQGDRFIIEIQGRDRPGLLWELSACLRNLELNLLSAHVENVGIMAVDAFYVRCYRGSDLASDIRQSEIRQALLAVLDDAAVVSAA
jgi:[protein-PII] uridylyltransferase